MAAAEETEQKDAGDAPLVKFPRTEHVLDAGGSGVTRDDLLMDAADARIFYNGELVVAAEEKVDGANVGLSIDRDTMTVVAQNRSHFVNSATQVQFACVHNRLGSCENHNVQGMDRILYPSFAEVAVNWMPGSRRTGPLCSISWFPGATFSLGSGLQPSTVFTIPTFPAGFWCGLACSCTFARPRSIRHHDDVLGFCGAGV